MKSLSRNITPILLAMVLIATMLFMVVGCRFQQRKAPLITVSILPQKQLLEQIAGDRVEITSLLQSNSNPENYEPSMNDVMALEHCQAYFTIGNIGYEYAIVAKAKNYNRNLKIFNTSEGIDYIKGHGQALDDINPHVWISVKNAKIIAGNMLKALNRLFPNDEKFFTKRYDRLMAHLDCLDKDIALRLANQGGGKFLVSHPTLSYFARDYGLEQIVLDSGHYSPGAIEKIKRNGATTLFFQPQFDGIQAEQLNRRHHLNATTINTMAEDWEKQMRLIAETLATRIKE